jgi:hypothetical protein
MRLAAVLSLLAAPLAAQQPATLQDEIAYTRQEIATNRQEIVRQSLKLDEAQGAKFWPLYREYKAEQSKIADKQWATLTEFAKSYESLDDVTSKKVLDEWLAAGEDRAKLAKKWRGKFGKAIGDKNTLRFYQIEGKLDHLIQREAIAQIPLVR